MARNRKRAKERRARRPEPVTARNDAEAAVPGPILHAAPDVELAEAQLALGRPELADEADEADVPESDEDFEDLDAEAMSSAPAVGDGGRGDGGRRGRPSGGGELAVPGASVPEPRPRPAARLVTFLQGSWRELQRVQWPDRRQVLQATGVVIGFVIVAGVFLGVADWAATKIVNYILK